ncbi:Serine proteasec [Arthrobacter saudimassiliensis]|uniref:Serine proteasec n=1 Tax=Arthrobacter saudimassiliensis TaxID=1461584 RepID=A0A078MUH5_9MICC|nr:Serine proteasec [Arthrobacter saudimassiliensis]
MLDLTVLDIILLLLLLSYLVAGLRKGLMVTLGGLLGFLAGGVAAFFAVPFVSAWVPDPTWRMVVVLAVAVVLVIGGHAAGAALGAGLRRWLNFRPLRGLDRALGGVLNVGVAALVMSILAFSLTTLGMPAVSQQIASSRVLAGIDRLTPEPVDRWTAQLRSFTLSDGLPTILDSAAPQQVEVPAGIPDTEGLRSASASVLKITGTAFQCGQNQTGSGFVVADERVVTNAHVVAGVDEPVVQLLSGGALPARVVHFDAARDLAVLAVDGLSAEPIPLGTDLARGDTAAFAGYPAGGPFRLQGAGVEALSDIIVRDIYGDDPKAVQVYTLAANVQQGNSGGPLLDTEGRAVGVIFAKTTGDQPIGYALSAAELAPLVQAAPDYAQPVSAGECTSR